ncbi:MAG: DUF2190 family protein [Planctomycetota bacterium]|nr:MAG: DUF2190 family protein [Planctomycetota bacterium]
MGKYNDSGYLPCVADEAIGQYLRVKFDSDGRVTKAGLTDQDIGVAMEPAFAAGDAIPVKLRNAPGTVPMVADEAMAVGALVYTEADGEVQDTAASTAFLVGRALEAATAAGDIIEVLRFDGGEANA